MSNSDVMKMGLEISSPVTRSRLCDSSATAGSPGEKIPDHQDEDHEGKEQQHDIPACPYGGIMHDKSSLHRLSEQGVYR